MRFADWLLPHLHLFAPDSAAEGIRTQWDRTALLVLAITLHNIPEGLAIGVAFGGVTARTGSSTLGAAIALAIGIGLQNCPEGTAVAVPLRREGMSRVRSFWYGQMSAWVEPIAAMLGALAVVQMRPVLSLRARLRRRRDDLRGGRGGHPAMRNRAAIPTWRRLAPSSALPS